MSSAAMYVFIVSAIVGLSCRSTALKEQAGFQDHAPSPAPPPAQSGGADVESRLRTLRTQLTTATSRLARLEADIEREVQARLQKERELVSRMQSLDGSAGSSQCPGLPDPVAFTATVSQRLARLPPSATIIFGTVQTNLGNAYNSTTGKFRCPVRGLYYFTVTIMSSSYDSVQTQIAVNGQKAAVNYAGGNRYGGSGSNAILLQLNQGDSVWIRLFDHYGENVEAHKSTFSGYLVQPLS